MNLDQTTFEIDIVPDDNGKARLHVDLLGIAEAEVRLSEMATANGQNADELCSFYNEVWLRLDRNVTLLTYQRNRAEEAYEDARADALLACTDEVMSKKGFKKTSTDLREAYARKDPNVKSALERFEKLKVIQKFLQGKAKSFERAFRAVDNRRRESTLPKKPLGDAGRPEPMQGPGRPVAQTLLDNDDPFGQNDEVGTLPEGFGPTRW